MSQKALLVSFVVFGGLYFLVALVLIRAKSVDNHPSILAAKGDFNPYLSATTGGERKNAKTSDKATGNLGIPLGKRSKAEIAAGIDLSTGEFTGEEDIKFCQAYDKSFLSQENIVGCEGYYLPDIMVKKPAWAPADECPSDLHIVVQKAVLLKNEICLEKPRTHEKPFCGQNAWLDRLAAVEAVARRSEKGSVRGGGGLEKISFRGMSSSRINGEYLGNTEFRDLYTVSKAGSIVMDQNHGRHLPFHADSVTNAELAEAHDRDQRSGKRPVDVSIPGSIATLPVTAGDLNEGDAIERFESLLRVKEGVTRAVGKAAEVWAKTHRVAMADTVDFNPFVCWTGDLGHYYLKKHNVRPSREFYQWVISKYEALAEAGLLV